MDSVWPQLSCETYWLIGAVSLFCIVAIVTNWLIAGQMNEKLSKMTDNTLADIKKTVSPRVSYASDIISVRQQVTSIVQSSANKAGSLSEKNQIEDQFITFYGAASLSNFSEGSNNIGRKARSDSILEYTLALKAAFNAKIRLRRYIAFPTIEEFRTRSNDIQIEFTEWLDSQVAQISENPDYHLITTPRAPVWGTSSSTVIAPEGIVEIKAKGGSSISITDQTIATQLRKSLRDEIEGTQITNKVEYSSRISDHYSQTPEDLRRVLDQYIDTFLEKFPGETTDILEKQWQVINPTRIKRKKGDV